MEGVVSSQRMINSWVRIRWRESYTKILFWNSMHMNHWCRCCGKVSHILPMVIESITNLNTNYQRRGDTWCSLGGMWSHATFECVSHNLGHWIFLLHYYYKICYPSICLPSLQFPSIHYNNFHFCKWSKRLGN